jgi:hypothetical protein
VAELANMTLPAESLLRQRNQVCLPGRIPAAQWTLCAPESPEPAKIKNTSDIGFDRQKDDYI